MKFNKSALLNEIIKSETTAKHQTAHDVFAQDSIREEMKRKGYKYVGNPGAIDATEPGSYKP